MVTMVMTYSGSLDRRWRIIFDERLEPLPPGTEFTRSRLHWVTKCSRPILKERYSFKVREVYLADNAQLSSWRRGWWQLGLGKTVVLIIHCQIERRSWLRPASSGQQGTPRSKKRLAVDRVYLLCVPKTVEYRIPADLRHNGSQAAFETRLETHVSIGITFIRKKPVFVKQILA